MRQSDSILSNFFSQYSIKPRREIEIDTNVLRRGGGGERIHYNNNKKKERRKINIDRQDIDIGNLLREREREREEEKWNDRLD